MYCLERWKLVFVYVTLYYMQISNYKWKHNVTPHLNKAMTFSCKDRCLLMYIPQFLFPYRFLRQTHPLCPISYILPQNYCLKLTSFKVILRLSSLFICPLSCFRSWWVSLWKNGNCSYIHVPLELVVIKINKKKSFFFRINKA